MPNFNALMPGPSFDIGNSIKNANSLAGMIDARKERERVAGAENALRQYVQAADEPTRKNAMMELANFDPEATLKVRGAEEDATRQRVTDGLQLLSGVKDQPSWEAAIRTYTYLHPGADVSHLPAEYSPAVVGQMRQQLEGIVGARGASSTARPVAIPDSIGPDGQVGTTLKYADGTEEFVPQTGRAKEKVGAIPAGYRLVNGRLERIPGADEALVDKDAVRRMQQAGDAATELMSLEQALMQLPEAPILLKLENAKAYFGQGDPKLQQALGNIARISGKMLAYVERLPGAATDKDREDFKGSAGVMSDETKPTSQRLAAARSARASFERILEKERAALGDAALPGNVVTQPTSQPEQNRPPLKSLIQRR
jgi:hypothetical protein